MGKKRCPPNVGETAPDFVLKDHNGKEIRLSESHDRQVLLSDFWPHGEVARAYGIFREKNGSPERANIIVDMNGKIAFVKVYEIGQLPDIAEVMKVLERLHASK